MQSKGIYKYNSARETKQKNKKTAETETKCENKTCLLFIVVKYYDTHTIVDHFIFLPVF